MTRFTKMWIFLNAMVVMAMQITVSSAATWTEMPSNTTAIYGESAELKCAIDDLRSYNLPLWYNASTLVSSGEFVSSCFTCSITGNHTNGEYHMTITPVRLEDEGTWRCSASYEAIPSSYEAQLTVLVPANIDLSPSDKIINEGNTVILLCSATGKPTTIIYAWKKDSADISISGRYSLNGGSLTISNIVREDDGIYTCYANNGVGQSDSASATVTVHFPPTIHTFPSDQTVTEGTNSVTLQCLATGLPTTITYTWKKDSADINISGRYSLNGGSLTISNIVREDDGIYTCYASNGVGQPHSASATVTVHFPATINTSPSDRTVTESNSVTLPCSATGKPTTITYTWKKDSADIIIIGRYILNGGSLTISNSVRSDYGIYTCYATNAIGDDTSDPATVNVKFDPVAASVLSSTDDVIMGTDLTLTCTTTTSKPPATISWYRGTEKLSDSDKDINIGNIEYSDGEYNGETSELQITITTTAKDNKADFKCIARNSDVGGDVDSNSITTNVYFPPRYPSGCSTQLHGYPDNTGYVVAGNALTLTCMSCSSNPDADVQWYHGTQVVTSGLSDVSYHDGVYEGQTTTQNLTIQLSYHHHMDIFNCDAGNVYFASRESSNTVILNVRYEPFVVNDALNQRTAANQGDAAELRCEINSNPHSVIKWYGPGGDVIKKGNNIAIIITRNFTWQLNKLIINKKTGKDNGRYICNADNGIGSIDFTVVLSGKSFPDPATDIIVSSTHNTLHVVWNSGFNGGYPQSFFIEYGELPDGDQQFTEDTQDNELTVTKLQPLTGYYIIVVSTNALGEARSERLWTRTIEEPISSPIIIYLLSSALPILVLIAGSLMVVYLRMRCIKPRERQDRIEMVESPYDVITDQQNKDYVGDGNDANSYDDINIQPTYSKNVTDVSHYASLSKPEAENQYASLSINKEEHIYMKPETRICEFPRERVCITSVISSGRFYEMCKADAWNIDGKKEHAEVVVKKSIDPCNALIEAEIMKEIQTLHYIQGNKNVVKIIGCCTDQSPKYIILEQMPENLKNYLQFQCNTSTEHVSEVTQKDMFSFMMDIARGMEHLSKLKIIHRYLAAKHILISSNNTCKVSNFTYASNVINDDRFYEKTKDNFPYQWMAIETLLKMRFDWTSDVWSFGVVLWEIVTFGCSPHGSMTKKQVTDMIRMGKRLTKPPNCGKELYSAINSCWIHNVTNRPHFSQMIETINSLMNDGKAHIDVSNPGEILNIYQHN